VAATGLYQGFLRSASGKITIISYPGQSVTAAYGLNDFMVVAGDYATGNSGAGMLYHNGAYKSIVIGPSTGVNDINDYGYCALCCSDRCGGQPAHRRYGGHPCSAGQQP